MVDNNLLEILCCPVDRQALRVAKREELDLVNGKIQKKSQLNQAGRVVSESLTAALVTLDGKRLYPVVDGIPVMLVDESMALEA